MPVELSAGLKGERFLRLGLEEFLQWMRVSEAHRYFRLLTKNL